LGEEAMKKIFASTVMVIGAGAVGGQALETLARIGVGRIIVVDFDTFDETNINRQILAVTSTVGVKKVAAAKNRILDINPDCDVIIHDMYVDAGNIESLLSYNPDYIVDAIDSLNAKCELIEALSKTNIRFVSSMGAARKTNPFLIRAGKLDKTTHCSLAKQIRKRLKLNGVDISKVNCVFSTEEPLSTDMEIFNEDEKQGGKPPLGSIPTITAMFGIMIADTVVKHIIQPAK
jgi:tRNA A37 threonylcarbamoyladenosine dehydratase